MDKIWLSHYQQGVPHEINMGEYASLASFFEQTCHQFNKKTACVNLGHGISYAELEKRSASLAASLQQLGLKKGDRVAIMMPNLPQYLIAMFGILRAGMVVVNTNPLYTPDEVIHQMNDSGALAILVVANYANTVEKALPKTTLKHVIVTEIGDALPPIKRMIVNAVVKHIKKMVPDYNLPQAIPFTSLQQASKSQAFKPVELNHEDIAFLQYTGGTTGVSKGAILTHGNMIANILQTYDWILPIGISTEDTVVTALPMYHIFSLTANCMTFFKGGVKNILITNPRDMGHFIKIIKNCGISLYAGVNTLFNSMLHHPDVVKVDFSKLKGSLSGGMALQKSVSQKWQSVTHSPIIEAYGLTEASPAVTMNPMYQREYNGSIGLPLPSTDISLRDEFGQEVPAGERGELCVKGPQVMRGYWNRPEETAQVFTADGYLRTGDIAVVDEKGFFYIVDRKKDMILVSGFNVYPNEIEQVISMMPGVLEVGVIGEQCEETGERVKACIVKRNPDLTSQEVIAHCRQHLTAYKVPKVVEFYSELPKSNVGKILRRMLKAPCASV